MTEQPLHQEIASNTSSTSWALLIVIEIGWLVESPSSCMAGSIMSLTNPSMCWYSGCSYSVDNVSISVANDSLSHRSFHQFMVTKLPNHWCASSWKMTRDTLFFCLTPAVASSIRRSVSLYVTKPQFSIAPASKSLIAMQSNLGNGQFYLNHSSYNSRHFTVSFKAKDAFLDCLRGANILTKVPLLVLD